MLEGYRLKHFFGDIVAASLLTGIACILTMPLLFSVIIAAIITACLRLWGDKHAAILISASSFFSVLCLELILRNIPIEKAPQYYRPDEMIVQEGEKKHDLHYKSNKKIMDFEMPYGDLAALVSTPAIRSQIEEPRIVNFMTDESGHRNISSYNGEEYITFGDSFVMGSGVSQEETIAVQLSEKMKVGVYNAGFPGDAFSYIRKISEMQQAVGKDFKGILFFFEGNDFSCDQDSSRSPISRRDKILTFIPLAAQKTSSYRFFYGLTRRAAFAAASTYKEPQVRIFNISLPVAFLEGYIQNTERREKCWHWTRLIEPLKEVSESIRLIVFIPDKYRVYYKHTRQDEFKLPNVQSEFIEETADLLGIEFLDLTDALTTRSTELLQQTKYTWWRDDTHWNPIGIGIAADEISERLNPDKKRTSF